MTEVRTTTPPIEVVTPIKPSEAIRLGCLTTAPTVGTFFDGSGGACALGAMAVGLGYRGSQRQGFVPKAYELVAEALPPRLPAPSGREVDAIDAVWIRNDSDDWTREQIADWLESRGL